MTDPIEDLMRMTMQDYIERQINWSLHALGPGERVDGLCDHITKELAEIKAEPNDLMEWCDVVILALDGAWRQGYSAEQIAVALDAKQRKNIKRAWPDWRTAEPGKAIEHIRGTHD